MKTGDSAFFNNLKVFVAAYPPAIFATGSTLMVTLIAARLLNKSDDPKDIFIDAPLYQFWFIIPLVLISLFFILIVPCAISFAVLKQLGMRGLIAYLSAGGLISAILSIMLATIALKPLIIFTYYDLAKATLQMLSLSAPSVFAGTFIFNKVEQKMVQV